MSVRTRRPLLISALLAALVAVGLAAAPPRQALASPEEPQFYAWDLRADFETGAYRVILTSYNGDYDPPQIHEWVATDITSQCAELGPGSITYQNGRAIFDGASLIRCTLPTGIVPPVDQCEDVAFGNFWFSAEGSFNQVSAINPMLKASDDSFYFNLPSSGSQARTRVQFPTQVYQSNNWPISSSWNEVLMGQYGPMIVEAASKIPDLLENLDLSWETYFLTVGPNQVGHRMFSPSAVRSGKTGAAQLPYADPPPMIDIGYNDNTGAYFNGTLAYVEVDPPACTAK